MTAAPAINPLNSRLMGNPHGIPITATANRKDTTMNACCA